MHSVLLITLYSFFTAVLMLIVKGNSMKTANYEAFTKEQIYPKKLLLVGGMVKILQPRSFYHSLHLVQKDFNQEWR